MMKKGQGGRDWRRAAGEDGQEQDACKARWEVSRDSIAVWLQRRLGGVLIVERVGAAEGGSMVTVDEAAR